MKHHLKHSVFLGIALLLLSLTSACSQKRGLGLQSGGGIPAEVLAEANRILLQRGISNPSAEQLAPAVAWVMTGNTDPQTVARFLVLLQSNYNLRPAYVFSEITSGARVYAEGDHVYLTGSGEGFGIFSFSAGYFMSGYAALQQGPAQGVNLFSSTNTRSVRSMAKVGTRFLVISSDSGLFWYDVSNPVRPYQFDYQRVGPFNSLFFVEQTGELVGLSGNTYTRIRASDRVINPGPTENQLLSFNCEKGAAQFRGKIYVAGCDQLWVMNPNSFSGGFDPNYVYTDIEINPQLIAAGGKYLYVYHSPVMGTGSVNARSGIYVFDQNETQVNFINLPRLKSFAVSGDDRYIVANEYDEDVAIYRIPWTR